MSFIQAGNEAVRAALKARSAAERNKPKYDRFGKRAIQDQTAQDLLSMEIRGRAQEAALTSKSNKKTKDINREAKAFAKKQERSARMAGKLAGGAALIGGAYFMSKREEEENEVLSLLQKQKEQTEIELREKQKEIEKLRSSQNTETITEQDQNTPSLKSSDSSTSSTKETLTGSSPSLTSAFNIIGKYESDSSGGYDAYNLGGSQGGTVAYGSGNSADGKQFGAPLTSMSIGKIKQLQANGQLHAAGRFQFIGNSLPEAARFAGLSDNDIFSPENQNKMVMAFGKKYGSGRWVGLQKASEEERNIVDRAFDNYQL